MPGITVEALEDVLRRHDAVPGGPGLLKQNLGTRVTSVPLGPSIGSHASDEAWPTGEGMVVGKGDSRSEGVVSGEVVVKEVPVRLLRRLSALLGRMSRFCAEFEKVAALERLGVRSPRPIACSLRSRGRTELLISEHLEGIPLRDLLWLGERVLSRPEDLAALLVPLGRWIRRLHDHGIWQRDMKPSNILLESRAGGLLRVEDEDFVVVDITAIRFTGEPLDRERRVRNLSQLLDLTHTLDSVARPLLLRGYAGGSADAAADWLEDVDCAIEARRSYREKRCGYRFVDEEHAASRS